jgi:dimethylglycine dehydrogenase
MILLAAPHCKLKNRLAARLNLSPLRLMIPMMALPFGEAVYLSNVSIDGVDAGLVVSAGYGHRVGASIAMAVVDRQALAKAKDISVLVLGRKRRATVVKGHVLYDPENAKMKV